MKRTVISIITILLCFFIVVPLTLLKACGGKYSWKDIKKIFYILFK